MGWEIACAYFLDFLAGDPRFSFHPVRIIGKIISGLEGILRRIISNEKLGGSVLAIVVVGSTYVITWSILKFAGMISTWLVFILNILLIYSTISVRDLAVHSRTVQEKLEYAKNPPYSPFSKGGDEGDYLDAARTNLSKIVGRDTGKLNESEIIRGTVESVAESTVDGIISPLFYAFIGGAPLAMVFKAISTLDSMVGYKNEKYINFGWLSAKLDDIANWIPARISAFLIPVAAFLSGYDGRNSYRAILRDGKKPSGSNSVIPESGFAGAFHIQLGGENYYEGQRIVKPFIGGKSRSLQHKDILYATNLMFATSIVMLVAGEVIYYLLRSVLYG